MISGYPAKLETLGDHIRAARLDRNLRQKDVANQIGVNPWTVLNWEIHKTDVVVRHYPRVMDFLGYCPVDPTELSGHIGARVRLHRIHRGLSLREAAKQIGVDPGALSRWECGAKKPSAKSAVKLTRFIDR